MPQQQSALRWARRVRIWASVAVYTLLSPVGYGLLAVACSVDSGDPKGHIRRIQRLTSGAYKALFAWMRWTRVAHFDPRDALPGLPPPPFVVVANHPTIMDVAAITAALGGAITVAKPSLFRRRSLRPLLEGAGHLEGPGGDPVAAGRLIDHAVERLQQGFPLLVFPEGTRSPPGRMHRFGRAAFEIACRAQVPLVSVAVSCEPLWLSKEVKLFDPPHPMPRLRLSMLATDEPARLECDARQLKGIVERRYRAWLDLDQEPVALQAGRPAEDRKQRSTDPEGEEPSASGGGAPVPGELRSITIIETPSPQKDSTCPAPSKTG